MTERKTMLVVMALASGCSDTTTVSVPFELADQAAIIAVVGEGLELFAVDAARRAESPILTKVSGEAAGGRIELYAVFYRATLAELGLSAGQLSPMPEGAGQPLPGPFDRALHLSVEAGQPDAWSALDALPPQLLALRVARRSACARFEALESFRSSEKYLSGIIPKDDDEAWAVSQVDEGPGTGIYAVRVDGRVQLLRQMPLLNSTAAGRSRDGQLLIAGHASESEVWKGDPAQGMTRLPPRPDHSRYSAIRDMSDEEDSGLYVIDNVGNVDRFFDGRWISVVRSDFSVVGPHGVVAPISAEEQLLVAPDGKRVLRVQRGVISPEVTPADEGFRTGNNLLRSLEVLPGGVVLAGTVNGPILRRRGEAWEVISEALIAERAINDLEPYAGTVLEGGSYGAVEQYLPDEDRFCRDEVLYLGNTLVLGDLTVVGNTLLYIGFDQLPGMGRELRIGTARIHP